MVALETAAVTVAGRLRNKVPTRSPARGDPCLFVPCPGPRGAPLHPRAVVSADDGDEPGRFHALGRPTAQRPTATRSAFAASSPAPSTVSQTPDQARPVRAARSSSTDSRPLLQESRVAEMPLPSRACFASCSQHRLRWPRSGTHCLCQNRRCAGDLVAKSGVERLEAPSGGLNNIVLPHLRRPRAQLFPPAESRTGPTASHATTTVG